MRLIDADTLKKSIKSYADDQYDENEYLGEYAIMDIIDNAPTIIYCSQTPEGLPLMDLRERSQSDFKEGYKQAIIDGKTNYSRPQGEWIVRDGEPMTYKCSFCGELNCCKGNFCPDCGADMRGENK